LDEGADDEGGSAAAGGERRDVAAVPRIVRLATLGTADQSSDDMLASCL